MIPNPAYYKEMQLFKEKDIMLNQRPYEMVKYDNKDALIELVTNSVVI